MQHLACRRCPKRSQNWLKAGCGYLNSFQCSKIIRKVLKWREDRRIWCGNLPLLCQWYFRHVIGYVLGLSLIILLKAGCPFVTIALFPLWKVSYSKNSRISRKCSPAGNSGATKNHSTKRFYSYIALLHRARWWHIWFYFYLKEQYISTYYNN